MNIANNESRMLEFTKGEKTDIMYLKLYVY